MNVLFLEKIKIGITGHLSSKDAIFVLGLMWLHEARRLYECIFVHRWSHGLMSLLAYSVGMLHYILAPITVLCEVEIETESSSSIERWKPGLGQLIGAICLLWHWWCSTMLTHSLQSYGWRRVLLATIN